MRVHSTRCLMIVIVGFLVGGCTPAASVQPQPTPLPSTPQAPQATATAVVASPTLSAAAFATTVMPPTPSARPAMPTRNVTLPITVTEDIVYAKGTDHSNIMEWRSSENAPVEWHLDEYAPVEPGPWPAVVLAHGSGSKADWREMLPNVPKMLAEQGVRVYAIDYPAYQPETAIADKARGYREMADALACAVRFARARASASGNDGARVALVGFSLGGGAASQVALAGESIDSRWDAYAASGGGPPRQVGCEVSKGSTPVDALVGIAGTYDTFLGTEGKYGRAWMQEKDAGLWKMLHSLIGENLGLKVRLLHSKKDDTIPYDNSLDFQAPLAAAGYDVKVIDFNGGHMVPPDLTVQTVMNVLGN